MIRSSISLLAHLVGLGLIAAARAQSQPPEASELLMKAQESLRIHQTIEFTLDRVMDSRVGDKSQHFSDHVSVSSAGNDKLRIDRAGAFGDQVVFSDAQQTLVYGKHERAYARVASPMLLSLPLAALGLPLYPGIARFPSENRTLGHDSVVVDGEKHDSWVVQIRADGDSGPMLRDPVWLLWLDKKSSFPLKSTLSASLLRNGFVVHVDLSATKRSLHFDRAIPESEFKFTPPKKSRLDEPKWNSDPDYFRDDFMQGAINLAALMVSVNGSPLAFENHPLLLAFAPLWCEPCRDAMATLSNLNDEFVNKALLVIQYTGADAASVADYLKQFPVSHFVASGTDYVMSDLVISGVPAFVVIDRQGEVAGSLVGFDSETEASLRRMLVKVGVK